MASRTHEVPIDRTSGGTPTWRVPFNRPSIEGRELEYVAKALRSDHISGDGEFTKQCQLLLETELGVSKALLTTSCTHALEMSALLLDVKDGDEVIVPSFTFVSTANAFVLRGAKPVFIDIRPDTLNFDERLFEGLVTPRTKVAVPVHYAGVGCEMDSIMQTARTHGIAVVEDNAHGLFGKYRGQFLGTFGSVASQSFHETKNFSCGEGGAVLVNDPALTERAEILREKGTDRSRYFRGQVDKYTWRDIGSSYLPSDLLAAVLLGQLEMRQSIQAVRERLWHRYSSGLNDWARAAGVTLPVIPSDRDSAYHLFHLLLPNGETRQGLIQHLRARGILSVFHYVPLHLSAMGRKFGGREGQCPVTEQLSDCLLRLPFYNSMSDVDQDLVIEAIRDFKA
ncbi:MAG TPA: dTDP-4-amino-4,6-dideoxygalactose transaminase [Candidatus Dormibacteraeota bacterium]|nr:dTDP-4-amino-4,6-dideoxygalactose transaminase [Candidatus Dormibacteraeota bacterium]